MKIDTSNKKGWIKIVEAAVAVLLIISVLLIVINKSNPGGKDVQAIYEKELAILREIRLNDSMRNEILFAENESLPIEWDYFNNANQLENIKIRITNKTPDGLNCSAKLCLLGDSCVLNENPGGETYVQSISIVANLTTYRPRQLKLFCWEEAVE